MERNLQNLLDEYAFFLQKHPILAKVSRDKEKMALLKKLKNGGVDEEKAQKVFWEDYEILLEEDILSRVQSGGKWIVILGFEGLKFLELYEKVGSII